MEIQITINFNFSRSLNSKKELSFEERDALEKAAKERIFQQIDEGYTSGELLTHIAANNGKEVEYSGYWSLDTKVIS